MAFSPTSRTTSLRDPQKLSYDRESVNAILDEALICQIAYVHNGAPRLIPTAFGSIGGTLYVHGSTGSRLVLDAHEGLDVCISITLHDGIVFSRSWFHHSVNYRSLIVHGRATVVTSPEEKERGLASIVDQLSPQRSRHSRPPTPKELASTGLLAVPLEEVSVRAREGGPNEDSDDLELPHWAGELPLSVTTGAPIPDTGVSIGTASPPSRDLRSAHVP